MRHPRRTLAPQAVLLLVILGAAIILHACQGTTEVSDVELALLTNDKRLVVSGDGTGSGTVTVPVTAGRKALTCSIILGLVDPLNCNKYYPHGTLVTLTATPATDHSFTRWTGACAGTQPTCTLEMTQVRKVTASFAAPASDFALTVTGNGSGSGSVVAGTPPGGLDCTITAGLTTMTGCTSLYPAQTELTLSATPDAEQTFIGWGGDCTAAGDAPTCQLTMSQNRSVSATFNALGAPAPEATRGKWSAPFSTPVIAIHMALMPDRKVLLYGHTGQPWLWNPSSFPNNPGAGYTQVSTSTEVFCSGHTFLADGRLFAPGGHDEVQGNGYGIPDVNIFGSSGWQAAPPMAQGRWYPTATTLASGEVVVTAGTDNAKVNVKVPEVWNGATWRRLTSASVGLPYYPRMFLAPNGFLFYAGPSAMSRYLNPTGNGAWTNVSPRVEPDRNYGSAVMFDAKVLTMGGGGEPATCATPVTNTAEIIDLNSPSPIWRAVGSMARRRRQLNATILADGKVLVTGGTSACGFSNESGSEFTAEVWDPATEQWTTLAGMAVKRVYHSAAILLPDARVLSAGGGDNPGSTNQFNAEIFTPPYLFNSNGTLATRPTYSLASNTVSYDQAFTVNTPNAASVAKVTLIRPSAVTHTFNQSQQLNTLSFTPAPGGTSLTAHAPANGRLAPPGPYMLFLVDDRGVPSVAQIVFLQ